MDLLPLASIMFCVIRWACAQSRRQSKNSGAHATHRLPLPRFPFPSSTDGCPVLMRGYSTVVTCLERLTNRAHCSCVTSGVLAVPSSANLCFHRKLKLTNLMTFASPWGLALSPWMMGINPPYSPSLPVLYGRLPNREATDAFIRSGTRVMESDGKRGYLPTSMEYIPLIVPLPIVQSGGDRSVVGWRGEDER